MNGEEFGKMLGQMEAAAKERFKRQLGWGGQKDAYCVEEFVTHSEWQAKVCHALGDLSTADRVAQATIDAARYAKRNNFLQWVGIGVGIAVGASALVLNWLK